jgi:integrase
MPKSVYQFLKERPVARTTRPLTNTEVLRAKALEKDLTLHDGDGLFLIVKTSGKKLWRFRYQRPATKQRTMMGLCFPALSLADARGLRADYLALLANGIDPQIQAEVAEEQQQIALDSIFSTVAANWFQLKSVTLITQKTFGVHWRKMYSLPSVRSPFSKSKPELWLKPLSQSKHVGRLRLYVDWCSALTIMIYAVNTGLIDANPASGVGMAFEKPKKQNMPTLRPEELPKLMRSLVMSNLSVPTRCLIEWQLLTLVRPSEASGARWAEIDLDAKLWTIPAERMKAKREHIVPLSPQALEILEVMKPISAHREHVFPSRNDPKQPMNSQTANAALKALDMVVN